MTMIPHAIKHIADKYPQLIAKWMKVQFAALFNQVADPVIEIRAEDVICLKVTEATYISPNERPATIGDYQLEKLEGDQDKNCIYINKATKNIIIGYKGTDIKDFKDLSSDLEIILGVSGLDKRLKQSLKVYDKIRKKFPAYTKWICGHSLGGTIAYIVAKHRLPDRCTVFNPGSSPNMLFVHMLTDTMQGTLWTKNVYTYKMLGDPISAFSYVGNTKVFRIKAIDPLFLHSIENFNTVKADRTL
jgi:hypothetical protein